LIPKGRLLRGVSWPLWGAPVQRPSAAEPVRERPRRARSRIRTREISGSII